MNPLNYNAGCQKVVSIKLVLVVLEKVVPNENKLDTYILIKKYNVNRKKVNSKMLIKRTNM